MTTPLRSRRLKLAVGYLLIWHLGVAAVAYPFLRQTVAQDARSTADIGFVLAFLLVAFTLYGAWMCRAWSRYALAVLLLVHFVSGLGDVLELNVAGLLYLSFAAADTIALDEVQKSSGLKLPWFLSWLR